jgi:hypothetical protein
MSGKLIVTAESRVPDGVEATMTQSDCGPAVFVPRNIGRLPPRRRGRAGREQLALLRGTNWDQT